MKETAPVSQETKTRRTVWLGVGLLSLFSFFKLGFLSKKKNIIACAPPEDVKTMKFLTQDGQLVEVDVSKVKSLQEKASNKEMQDWIKR